MERHNQLDFQTDRHSIQEQLPDGECIGYRAGKLQPDIAVSFLKDSRGSCGHGSKKTVLESTTQTNLYIRND